MDLEQAKRTSDVQSDEPTLGRPNAPLTLHYYADFQCPFCKELELSDMHRDLQESHVEPGHVQLVFVPFPVVGPDSVTAAMAAHEVWRQAPQVYWAWHKAMFEAQGPENSGWANRDGVLRISEKFEEIDRDRLAQALDEETHLSKVKEDKERARESGVGGTPSMYLDGERVEADEVAQALRRQMP